MLATYQQSFAFPFAHSSSGLNDSSVEVRWEGISLNTFAGAPQGYKIVYYENTTAHAPMYQHVFAPGLINITRVGGLRNNTLYSITVIIIIIYLLL